MLFSQNSQCTIFTNPRCQAILWNFLFPSNLNFPFSYSVLVHFGFHTSPNSDFCYKTVVFIFIIKLSSGYIELFVLYFSYIYLQYILLSLTRWCPCFYYLPLIYLHKNNIQWFTFYWIWKYTWGYNSYKASYLSQINILWVQSFSFF